MLIVTLHSREHSYFIVRGEILGFMKDELLQKHLPRMFSLIKNESWPLPQPQYSVLLRWSSWVLLTQGHKAPVLLLSCWHAMSAKEQYGSRSPVLVNFCGSKQAAFNLQGSAASCVALLQPAWVCFKPYGAAAHCMSLSQKV